MLKRPLKTAEEMIKAVGRYIYLESPKYKGYGTLIAFENGMLVLEVNDKGRMKKIEIKFDDARKVRTAIKF
ncbi:MAG: hypothetical protein LRY20_00325 [Acholeplasmataceae bacterium]|nr:hypothetical protein [Acholeplasmataceae bacterium]